jgi:hypothetical protein
MLFSHGPSFGFSGQPVLIAWANDWGSPSAEVMGAVREQLRALGATLWVAAESGSFCLPGEDTSGEAPAAIAALPPPHASPKTARPTFTLMLFDGAGNLRFQVSREVQRGLPETLLYVLHVASRSVTAARSVTVPSELAHQSRAERRSVVAKDEVVILSLMGALSLLMLEAGDAALPAPGSKRRTREHAPLAVR